MDGKTLNARASKRKELFTRFLSETPIVNALWRAFEYERFGAEELRAPILDIGCGDGFFVKNSLKQRIDVGIDLNFRELKKAKVRDCYRHLVQGTATNLPFPDGSFRTIISNCVFEHIVPLERLLDEAARVLRPGGRLIITVPSEYYGNYFLNSGNRWIKGLKISGPLNRLFFHHNVDHWRVWERNFERSGLRLTGHDYLIGRDVFNRYLAWFFLAMPGKLVKTLLGRWVITPRGWIVKNVPALFSGEFEKEDEAGVCYFLSAQKT